MLNTTEVSYIKIILNESFREGTHLIYSMFIHKKFL